MACCCHSVLWIDEDKVVENVCSRVLNSQLHIALIEEEALLVVEVSEELVLAVGYEQTRKAEQILLVFDLLVKFDDLLVAAILPYKVLQDVSSMYIVNELLVVFMIGAGLRLRLAQVPSVPEEIEGVPSLQRLACVFHLLLVCKFCQRHVNLRKSLEVIC